MQFFRLYKRKDTKELVPSKKPIVGDKHDILNSSSYCREMLMEYLRDIMLMKLDNTKVPSNHYVGAPLAGMDIDGKKIYLSAPVTVISNDIMDTKFYSEPKNCKLFYEVTKCILGSIIICLSHEDIERERQKSLSRLKLFTYWKEDHSWMDLVNLKINFLSPFYLVSPPLTSLILGIIRDCYNIPLVISNSEIEKNLLSKIDSDEMERIIREVDYKSALKVYKNIVSPFLLKNSFGILHSEGKQRAIKSMIESGYQKAFEPMKMAKYWERFSPRYGFDKFCQYFNKTSRKDKYEYYRGI